MVRAGLVGGRQAGFTYLGVIYAVAVTGIALAGTGVLWSFEGRREKEKELLFIGEEYRSAIASYALRTPDAQPGSAPVFPERLDQLLLDNRSFPPAHHLRRLYRDPMTGATDWQLIRREGRIVGIASRSSERPIKTAGFTAVQEIFASAGSYAEWQFIAEVSAIPAPPGGSAQ